MGRDWHAWHRAYDDPESSLSRRLRTVQRLVSEDLDRRTGTIRAISMCAGRGLDLIGVLADHPHRHDVKARLVEMDPALAGQAREAAGAAGLDGVEVVTGDAGSVDAYDGMVPADLVLVCGVFGNIPDADIRNTVESLPALCAPAATVIWTRHRKVPDLTPTIRTWFDGAGFEELAFESEGAGQFGVGANRLTAEPARFTPGTRLFTFAV